MIVEPVVGNMGCIPPLADFLPALREQTKAHGALLIFDEVMTGFRVALGGAQALYGIEPDITTLGKVIGGGLPVGAFGGSATIMDHVAPQGDVYQAGTLSGNPLAVAAGLAMLNALNEPMYDALARATQRLVDGLLGAAEAHGVEVVGNHVCGMFSLFFTRSPVTQFDHVANSDITRFNRFFHGMLEEGVYLAPSAFEAGFLSTAHDDAVIDETIAAADRVFGSLL